MSKLTGSHESSKGVHKPSEDDYLVVEDDLLSKSHDSSVHESLHSSPSPSTTPLLGPPLPTTSAKLHPDAFLATPNIKNAYSPSTKSRQTQPSITPHLLTSPILKVRYASLENKPSATVSFRRDGHRILDSLPPSDGKEGVRDSAEGEGSLSGPKSSEEARKVFQKMYDDHFDVLMTQLIRSYGLGLSWLNILRPLIMEATRTVRTDVYTKDVMDINEYVRVKKIPCGERTDSSLRYGVVCSKNVTHKKMETDISNPTVLLLKCAFDFQRRENQLSSFDTLHLQEHKYLNNLVDKVKAFRPSIILVQKSVSRLALENLFDLGIVVAVNVKPSVMHRVARCTRAEIMSSLDQLFFNVRLGTCGKFYLRNFTLESGINKTLMYFDVCEPKLGCVIALRGGTNRELKKVKKVTQFGLHLAYNSFLESAFLLDEFAWPGKVETSGEEEDEGVYLISEPYSSSCSTPEVPLYPSLAHPLSSLSPSDLVKRLEIFGLSEKEEMGAQETESTSRSEEVEDRVNSLTPQLCGYTLEGSKIIPPDLAPGRSDEYEDGEFERNVGTTSQVQVDSHTTAVSSQDGTRTDYHAGVEEPHTDATKTSSMDSTCMVDGLEQAVTPVGSGVPAQDPLSKLECISKDVLATLGEVEFKAALKRQQISISPRIEFKVPYLQTAAGREADVRQYLSCVIYWSAQFIPQRRAASSSKHIQKKVDREAHQDVEESVETGLTKTLVEGAFPEVSPDSRIPVRVRSQISFQAYNPSYKSVSEHPLTSSFLLTRANTNEMQAALADFRARAGQEAEDNLFFFKSANLATDYRLLLQNVFNKYKQFEIEPEEEMEHDSREEVEPDSREEVEPDSREEVESEKHQNEISERKKNKKRNWWRKKNKPVNEVADKNKREATSNEHKSHSDAHSGDTNDFDSDNEEGGVLNPELAMDLKKKRLEEEERAMDRENEYRDRVVGRFSREHTPGLARSGKLGHEVGPKIRTGTLEDIDHAYASSRTAGKDLGENLQNFDLEVGYNDMWLAIDQVWMYM